VSVEPSATAPRRVQGGEIIVTLSDFCAVYVKPANQPQLIGAHPAKE